MQDWQRRQKCNAHTPQPEGYLPWHEWAEQKAKTHEQHQCDGCGLWMIWKPRRSA